MKNTRPLTVWLLFVFFLWAAGKDFQLMVTHQQGVDYSIFEHHDQLPVFIAFLSVTFLLDFSASNFLLRPQPAGFWICLTAIAVGVVYNFLALSYALSGLQGVREAYALSRELRGLPAREANLDRIFTPGGMRAVFGLAVFFATVGAALLIYNRKYFSVRETGEARPAE